MNETYQSPFSERYGDQYLRNLWSERRKRHLWRIAWLGLLHEQISLGIITGLDGAEVPQTAPEPTDAQMAIARGLEIVLKHDLQAELSAFRSTLSPKVAPYLHLGATSSDIEDSADLTRITQSCIHIDSLTRITLWALSGLVLKTAGIPVLGRTHLMPAEPTTLGYRLAVHLQELECSAGMLAAARDSLKPRGIQGAVGTGANLLMLSRDAGLGEVWALDQNMLMATGQTYPRTRELAVLGALAQMAAVLGKLGLDLRLMHQHGILVEEKTPGQTGSSAMPHKTNPISAEKICSLARHIPALWREAWDLASLSALERTLDDSAARRYLLPEAFLATAEMLKTLHNLLQRLVIHQDVAWEDLAGEWRSWLPSRVYTLDRAKTGEDNYGALDELAGEDGSWQWFLHRSGAAASSGREHLGEWLFLDLAERRARELAERVWNTLES